METFSALLALCAGNSRVTGEFPSQRPVTRNFDVFSDLRLNKRLSKQSWGWWFETSSCPLRRHCNEMHFLDRNVCILMGILLKVVSESPTAIKSASVQVMTWYRTGDKPLPEPMVVKMPGTIWRHNEWKGTVSLWLNNHTKKMTLAFWFLLSEIFEILYKIYIFLNAEI